MVGDWWQLPPTTTVAVTLRSGSPGRATGSSASLQE